MQNIKLPPDAALPTAINYGGITVISTATIASGIHAITHGYISSGAAWITAGYAMIVGADIGASMMLDLYPKGEGFSQHRMPQTLGTSISTLLAGIFTCIAANVSDSTAEAFASSALIIAGIKSLEGNASRFLAGTVKPPSNKEVMQRSFAEAGIKISRVQDNISMQFGLITYSITYNLTMSYARAGSDRTLIFGLDEKMEIAREAMKRNGIGDFTYSCQGNNVSITTGSRKIISSINSLIESQKQKAA